MSVAPETAPASTATTELVPGPIAISSSSGGRVSGKPWKLRKTATVRTFMQEGVKTKSWESRMEKTRKEQSVKKLQLELSNEKKEDAERRRAVTKERRLAAEEKVRLEEEKAKMGLKRALRLRRKAGRSKKING